MSIHIYNRPTLNDGKKLSAFHKNSSSNNLSKEIEAALPGEHFLIRFYGDSIECNFDNQLTAGEITTLDAEVANFVVDNVNEHKQVRYREIDNNTFDLINKGFTYNGKKFPLSAKFQRLYTGLKAALDIMQPSDWPLSLNTKNNKESISIADATEFLTFYGTGVATMRTHHDSGTVIKELVRAATTVAEVDAVVDNR
jgi:hypothetical protein